MTRRFSQPSFSRSQSWASQARSDTTVEDSEPERQERRLKAMTKTTRRVKRKKNPVVGVAKRPEDVIELTDSSPSRPNTPVPRLLNAQPAPLVIIDVSDDNESSTRHGAPGTRPFEDDSDHVVVNGLDIEISGDGTLEDESLPSIGRVLGLPKAREQKVAPVPGSVSSVPPGPARLSLSTRASPKSSEDESDSDGSKLELGRFAYAAPNLLRRTASKTPSPIEREAQTPDLTSGAAKRTPTHRFVEDFADAQLSRLLKCVSCELAWTARKTVKEKMKHIQACAKKNRLTDETVRVLLRTELAKLPPVTPSSKSKSPAEPPAPSVPETLLEETLKDKRRKRPGPRLQVEPTVKEVSETRDDILDKARLLLLNVRSAAAAAGYSAPRQSAEGSTGSADRNSAIPPATQAFAKSAVAVRANDHRAMGAADTTQAFGSSRLGVVRIQEGIIDAGAAIAGESDVSPLTQVFTRSELASAMVEVDPTNGIPLATQVFAPSKLTNGGSFTRKVVPANDDPMDEPISLHDTSEDEIGLDKSSPARPRAPVIEIPSSPSSNARHPLPSPTETSPCAPAAVPAILDPRSPSPPARSRSSPGEDPGSPVYYDDGPEFHVQDECEYLWNEWDHDRNVWDEPYDDGGHAFLHYDPDADARPLMEPGWKDPAPASPPPSPPRWALTAIPEDEGPVPGPSRLNEPLLPVEAATKKKRGRPRKVMTDESDAEPGTATGKDISQEELNAKLKEAVLKDEALHLRILRFEPIHFDVFMQLAADAGVTEKKTKLKGKVRTFLDQKAIHFYGADPTKSRTRRTRHP